MNLETLLEAAQYVEHGSTSNAHGESSVSSNEDPSAMPVSQSNWMEQWGNVQNGNSFERGKRRILGAGTREVHNKLEKNRRAHMKECFEQLKSQLPLNDRKTSNLIILRCALRTIQSLKRREKDYQSDIVRLKSKKTTLSAELNALKKDITTRHKNINVEEILEQVGDMFPDDITNSTSTASECGMSSETDDALDFSPIHSPSSNHKSSDITEDTVVVVSKSEESNGISNGKSEHSNLTHKYSIIAKKPENSLLKPKINTAPTITEEAKPVSKIKQEENKEKKVEASIIPPVSESNLHRLLVQPREQLSTPIASVPSVSSVSGPKPNVMWVTQKSNKDLPVVVTCSAQTIINPAKPVVMTQMLIPASTADVRIPVTAKPNQVTVGSVPSHITVLRAGGTTFTLPAYNNTTNAFQPAQPTLQLVAQPNGNALKLVPTTAATNTPMIPQAITIVRPPCVAKSNNVISTPPAVPSMKNKNKSKYFPISLKIPCSNGNEVKTNNNSITVLPISSSSKIEQASKPISMTRTSVATQNTSPLVTAPPFTFTKFSIKQISANGNSVAPNKSTANISSQPQVSVMTMNSHPPGKAYTQILHQTLLHGLPSTVASAAQVNPVAVEAKLNNTAVKPVTVASAAQPPCPSSQVLTQVARIVPQTLSVSPIVQQGLAVVPQQNMSCAVTRVVAQTTPIMSSLAHQVTTPVAQLVASPVSVVAGTINPTPSAQVLTSPATTAKLVATNHIPIRAVNPIPIVQQQFIHQPNVKPLVMVSNIVPQPINDASRIDKLKS